MINRFKFRVWAIEAKKWLNVHNFAVGKNGIYPFGISPESVVIQQFTGLKDIKNKEIYEGDIIKIESWRHFDYGNRFGQKIDEKPMNSAIGTIIFNKGCFELDLGCIWHDIWTPKKRGNKAYSAEPTIIGNIFENPNLLKNNRSGQKSTVDKPCKMQYAG